MGTLPRPCRDRRTRVGDGIIARTTQLEDHVMTDSDQSGHGNGTPSPTALDRAARAEAARQDAPDSKIPDVSSLHVADVGAPVEPGRVLQRVIMPRADDPLEVRPLPAMASHCAAQRRQQRVAVVVGALGVSDIAVPEEHRHPHGRPGRIPGCVAALREQGRLVVQRLEADPRLGCLARLAVIVSMPCRGCDWSSDVEKVTAPNVRTGWCWFWFWCSNASSDFGAHPAR